MMSYKLSPDAVDDIERLFTFGIDRFGVSQASKYIDGLEERLTKIANSPTFYPKVTHIKQGYRRSVYGIHSIYYRQLDKSRIEIMRVIGREHMAQLSLT